MLKDLTCMSTLQCWWRCKYLASERAGRNLPRRKLWCSCKWRTLGRSCLSPSSHSGCSPHWRAHIYKTRATVMTQQSTIGCRRGMRLWEVEEQKHSVQVRALTCFSAAPQSWLRSTQSPEMTREAELRRQRSKNKRPHRVIFPITANTDLPQRGSWGHMTTSWWKLISDSLLTRTQGFITRVAKQSMSQCLKKSNHPPGRGSQKFWMVCPSEPKWPGFHCQYTSYRVSSRSLTCWSDRRAPEEATTTTTKKKSRKKQKSLLS